MSLRDRGVKTPPKTKFQQWLDSLSEKNRAVVVGWLTDAKYTNADVQRMIRDDDEEDDFKGYPANKDTIANWRRNA